LAFVLLADIFQLNFALGRYLAIVPPVIIASFWRPWRIFGGVAEGSIWLQFTRTLLRRS